MKKLVITPPREPVPEQYARAKEQTLQSAIEEEEQIPEHVVLPKSISHLDFDKLAILKTKLKSATASQKEAELRSVLLQVIDYLGDDLEAHKKELVLYVMFKVERFILKPKQGALKKQICVKVLSPLFDGNESTTGLYIDALMFQHKQIKTLGRIGLRIFRYFVKNE